MVFVFPEGIDDVFVGVRVLFVEAVRNKAHPIAGISILAVRIVLRHDSVLRIRPKANVQLFLFLLEAKCRLPIDLCCATSSN
jgi:hypothetical protein